MYSRIFLLLATVSLSIFGADQERSSDNSSTTTERILACTDGNIGWLKERLEHAKINPDDPEAKEKIEAELLALEVKALEESQVVMKELLAKKSDSSSSDESIPPSAASIPMATAVSAAPETPRKSGPSFFGKIRNYMTRSPQSAERTPKEYEKLKTKGKKIVTSLVESGLITEEVSETLITIIETEELREPQLVCAPSEIVNEYLELNTPSKKRKASKKNQASIDGSDLLVLAQQVTEYYEEICSNESNASKIFKKACEQGNTDLATYLLFQGLPREELEFATCYDYIEEHMMRTSSSQDIKIYNDLRQWLVFYQNERPENDEVLERAKLRAEQANQRRLEAESNGHEDPDRIDEEIMIAKCSETYEGQQFAKHCYEGNVSKIYDMLAQQLPEDTDFLMCIRLLVMSVHNFTQCLINENPDASMEECEELDELRVALAALYNRLGEEQENSS